MSRVFPLLLAGAALVALPVTDSQSLLHTERFSPGDLEIGGQIDGAPPGSTRYIRYEDLLRLPQETYTVSDDVNLPAKTEITGVALETLTHLLAPTSSDSMVIAICDDEYRANYPQSYLAAHHPLLVLRINGKPHNQWPPLKESGNSGPFLISHPFFKPAFKVLSHEDEAQIPFGVVRIEFHRESQIYPAIQPPGNWPANSPVEQGYAIARQDCFRCHNMGAEGGTLAGRSWLKLAAVAGSNAARFHQIIRDPASVTHGAKMPAHKDYDDATLDALTAYFKTFATPGSRP